ncbi:MAG: SEL1-like repeat protein [Deltaproteobacteria bacterium]|nr:SEL1-like repeat protein [Deltaproteobacteria bacterium]
MNRRDKIIRLPGVFLVSLGILLLGAALGAEEKPIEKTSLSTRDSQLIGKYSESHALVIEVTEYTDGWQELVGISEQMDQLERVLIWHGFQVERVSNPTGEELARAFEKFIAAHGFETDNRLLFFFSGHGHSRQALDGRLKSYLVPSDAPLPEREPEEFRRKALSLTRLPGWAHEIEAKHALFVFDSHISGRIFEKWLESKTPPRISTKVDLPVRYFITAGSVGDRVPAKSFFTPAFVRALEGEGDLNQDGRMTGRELGVHLTRKMESLHARQTLQHGPVAEPALGDGDFVFTTPSIHRELEASISTPVASGRLLEALPFPSENSRLRKKCLSGEPARCVDLGYAYDTGRGVPTDHAEAARLYKLACDGGEPKGCTNLAGLLRKGQGVPQSYSEAARLDRLGCDANYHRACTNLGYLYSQGWGVPQSDREAVRLFQLACTGGDLMGCLNLGTQTQTGEGVSPNAVEAARLYRLVCDGGETRGCVNLGLLLEQGHGVGQNGKEAARLYRLSCESGNSAGCYFLGHLYEKGKLLPQEYSEAARFYRLACEGGDTEACALLGDFFESGKGVSKDLKEAARLYRLGCDGDSDWGCNHLHRLCRSGAIGPGCP